MNQLCSPTYRHPLLSWAYRISTAFAWVTLCMFGAAPVMAQTQAESAQSSPTTPAQEVKSHRGVQRVHASSSAHPTRQAEHRSTVASPSVHQHSNANVNLAVSSSAEGERNESLAPELMDIASQIYTGRLQCELGQVVMLLPLQDSPGRFQLTLKKQKYLMTPVLTPTGALKLEDQKLGAFWIQLGNKSMLFNSKQGQRMADECQGPGQLAVAMREKVSPPPSLFEPLPRVDH